MKIKELENAASNFGTPIYVYDLSIIESQNKKLQNAFKNLDNYKIHFAAKSLSNISVLKFIKNLEIGLDAVSIEEVKIGIKCGFNKNEILYTPNGVSFSEIKEAKSLGVKINLDSLESIKDFSEHYPNHSISVRINPGIYAGGNEKISVGHSNSKFGIPEELIEDLIKMDKVNKIKVTGLHIHTGSDITKNNQFEKGIKKIFSIATKFKNIESIDLSFLSLDDYQELKEAMIESYASMPNSYWKEHQIKTLIDKFPDGQVVIKVNNQIAGCALSIIVDYDNLDDIHTYENITGNYTFNTHDADKGDALYGIDVFIKPEYRGLRLGRRLYDYRSNPYYNHRLYNPHFLNRPHYRHHRRFYNYY